MNQYTDQPQIDANILEVVGSLDLRREQTELHLADGRVVLIATSLLAETQAEPSNLPPSTASTSAGSLLIPLVEEQLVVGKQIVETAKVRLQKKTQVYEEALDEPLAIRTFDIERVVLNRPVDVPPAIRQEGASTIYPVVEEQLILTKQLILREEVRVTRRDTERRDTQVVTLRREHLVVEREELP